MNARWDPDTMFPKAGSKARVPLLDPYVRWLHASAGRGLAQWHDWKREGAEPLRLQILARIEDPKKLNVLRKKPVPGVEVPQAYFKNLPGCIRRSQYFTAEISTQRGLKWLHKNPLKLHWKVAVPLRDAQRAAQASPKGRFGPTRDQVEMQARNLVEAEFMQPGVKLDRPRLIPGLIAVIDFGCPFLNDRFAIEDETRIVGVWHQGQAPDELLGKRNPDGWPWQAPADFGYGRELGPAALKRLRAFARKPAAPEETLIYRGLDYLMAYDDPRRRVWYATHGGMVLDLAAGSHDPLHPQAPPDLAAKARLLFIDLPTLTAADSAGCSLGARVLDGVRYAIAAADPDHPLVIVISYGNGAGPHDSSSLIERALDELIEMRGVDKLAIVLAAGNARLDGGHAQRTVAKDRSAMLRMQLAAGDTTDTFVEVWYPSQGSKLELRARSPGLVWSPWIAQGHEVLMRSDEREGEFVAMLRHDRQVPNGDGAMALLALSPTDQPPDVAGALVDPGLWEIEVRLAEGESDAVVINAWIERDDPVRGSRGERTRFIDQDETDEHNTLSGMATGKLTYKAAGFNLQTGRPAPYSSLPALEKMGQAADPRLVLAACEEDVAQRTVAAAATRSVDSFRMNGTSVAAPVLARWLFNAKLKPALAAAAAAKRALKPGGAGKRRPPTALDSVLHKEQDLVKSFEKD